MGHFTALISNVVGIKNWLLEEAQMVTRSPSDPIQLLKLKAEAGEECCVCLSRFEEDEVIRELPCRHSFHRACVDRWLVSCRRTCPLCRVPIDGGPVRGCEEQLSDDLVIWFSTFLVPGF